MKNSKFDEMMIGKIGDAVEKAIMECMTGYKSPIPALIASSLEPHSAKNKQITDEAISDLVYAPLFKKELVTAIRSKLAKLLISKMEGAIEKQVQKLRADPATRAKITVAIDSVIENTITNPVQKGEA